jgi:SAM-dependent methyltransferase
MHASSLENMQKFYDKYVKKWQWDSEGRISVIDIGGLNLKDSYADIFSTDDFHYQAVEIKENENVDIVLDNSYRLPFEDRSIDIVISGQAFEHVDFFWLLFEEIVRVIKKKGLIILVAPSSGPNHRHPVDCYRPSPDVYRALAKYTSCHLLDIHHDDRGPEQDLVGVFSKQEIDYNFTQHADSKNWTPNRIETETSSAAPHKPHNNKEFEITKGDLNYLDVLAKLHQTINPSLYLEIGVRFGRSLCLAKSSAIGVDPSPDLKVSLSKNHQLLTQTSDTFFETKAHKLLKDRSLDLSFIDGMHLFEFALRDFINIEKHSSPESIVVIDDIFPNHRMQANRKRETQVWTGDVWRLAECLLNERPDLMLTFLDCHPTGLLIISGLNRKDGTLTNKYNPLVKKYKELPLNGDISNKYLTRKLAIPSDDAPYWQWLELFFSEVKHASTDSKTPKANRIISKRRKKI